MAGAPRRPPAPRSARASRPTPCTGGRARPSRAAPRPPRRRRGSSGWPAPWLPAPPARPATTRSTSSASTPTSPRTRVLPLFRPLYDSWFRVEVNGVENIPADGRRAARRQPRRRAVAARRGDDARVAVHDRAPGRAGSCACSAPTWCSARPVLGTLARKTGSTLACTDDAERLLRAGELVGVWPEGFKGIGKPFRERYKLQRFGRGGFVHAALQTGVPIIPVSIVGSEEIHPVLGNAKTLARLLDLPYFPLTPTFPWLGPLGLVPLPSKWYIEFGAPIHTERLRRRRRPTTRCSSSTSPTGCARRSRARCTGCSSSAAPSGAERDSAAGRAGAPVAPRDAAASSRGGGAAAGAARPRRRRPPRRARARPGCRCAPPCGRCGSRGSPSPRRLASARSAESGLTATARPTSDEHRQVVDRVGVGRAVREVEPLARGERAHRGGLGLAVQHLADQPPGVDAVLGLGDGAERAGELEPVGR